MRRERLRLAVLATHPIQNHAPWYRALSEGAELHVFFSLIPRPEEQAVDFGGAFSWDVPLLEGYQWSELPAVRGRRALGRFLGLWSRDLGIALGRFAPDVVVLTGWNALPLLQGLSAAVRLGLPTVVRGDSNALRPRSARNRAAHAALFACYDAFVSVGKANRALYEGSGVPPERIFDGGHPVDEEHFLRLASRELPPRERAREDWGISEDALCFLFAGKLQLKKRPLDFVGALTRAAGKLPSGAIHGLVVGSGELEDEVRAAARAGRAPVTFTGFLNQSEIGRAYAAADVLVLPSDWGETWGLVVNEAMLFGRPAIVSDRVGCGSDLVLEGVTGSVFPFGNVEALADRMVRMASERSRTERMGTEASERIRAHSPGRCAWATLAAARFAREGV